jgi:phosphotransferase system HPr (HPr) family protein
MSDLTTTTAPALELVIAEERFLSVLQEECGGFCTLTGALAGLSGEIWNKRHYFPLISQAETFETLLDDYGASRNRTFSYLRELVGSLRGFAGAGHSLGHLVSRCETYGLVNILQVAEFSAFEGRIANVRAFIQSCVELLLKELHAEMASLGASPHLGTFSDVSFEVSTIQERLPHNVDEEEPSDDHQKIAEVASKFVSACDLLAHLSESTELDPDTRNLFLSTVCAEEQARVFEATVHNLQSAYDTHIKGTSLEKQDPRLSQLRGLGSAALHTLEAVTGLTHFVERHENQTRGHAAQKRLARLIHRGEVQDRILNKLLVSAHLLMEAGRPLAQDILPQYTDARELVIQIPDELMLHARPAALIVGIVSKYGTAVELEVGGKTCNAGSILEVLVTVGSYPDVKTFTFRGDVAPLRDIALLFKNGLGEDGIENLPDELSYLGHSSRD